MGTEALWIPLLMSAAGAGASAYNTNRTEKKQDNLLAGQLRQQASKQREADAKTAELITKTGQSDASDERASSLSTFMQQLAATKGNATGGLNQVGNVSDAFKASSADAALGVGSFGEKLAGLLASIDAPGQQRVNESTASVRFGQDIDQIKRRSSGDDFLAQMRLSGIKRNPWIDAFGSALSGAGGALASKGASASTATPGAAVGNQFFAGGGLSGIRF